MRKLLAAMMTLCFIMVLALPSQSANVTHSHINLTATDIGEHQMTATITTATVTVANIEPAANTIATNTTAPVADIQYIRLHRPQFARTKSKYINANFACNKCLPKGINSKGGNYRPTNHDC